MTHRSIPADYLQGVALLRPFYQYPVQSPDFGRVMADKTYPDTSRVVLTRALRQQYEGLELPHALDRNLNLLAQPGCYTVTTGHQLGIFGGPLFTLYKVASTIRLAERISRQHPGGSVVPVFWIHTEDHDFEEINHYFAGFGDRRTYPGIFSSAVGRHILNEAILDIQPAHFPQALKNAYQPGKSLAQATREFFHALFGEAGLVILDPDSAELKGLFRHVLRAEVAEQPTAREVASISQQMQASGYLPQVLPREINLFFLDQHGRHRIVPENGHFKVLERNLHLEPAEMSRLIEAHPERFSPNVSLRPLYQETILPNLAYIGGWGEIGYWLQLKGVFTRFKVNFPMLLPRFSATLFPRQLETEWRQLGFQPADIRKPLPELYKQYLPALWDRKTYDARVESVLTALDELQTHIATELSPSLARSIEALRQKNKRYLANMEKKAGRVIRSLRPAPFRDIERIKAAVQPDGRVQERVLSMAAFPEISPYDLSRMILAQVDPLDFQHKILGIGEIS